MSLSMIFRTLFEIAFFGVTVWALFHEERLATAEQHLFACLRRRRLKVIHGNRATTVQRYSVPDSKYY